jgi:Family of unknown function (DUF6088)
VNRAKHNSVTHKVRLRVERGGVDRLWTYADFSDIKDRVALAAALSRLTKAGELVRVRRGVYYRPKPTLFGPSRPDPEALVDAALRARGDTPVPSGMREYGRLGLTTQVSGAVTRATRRRVARDTVRGVPLRASTRPLHAQKGIRPEERTALDALRDITRVPDARPAEVLRRLGALIRAGDLDFVRLARFARVEPPRARALLGALGEELRHANVGRRVPVEVIEELRQSVNPLTSFHIPEAHDVLPHAAAKWRIK